MAKDKKDKGFNIKEGVSVKEIEGFVRQHIMESFWFVAVVIGTISSIFDFFTGPSWSLIFAGVGILVSIIFPENIGKLHAKLMGFLHKQEKTAQIVIGIVIIVISVFVPFILFAVMGLLAGMGLHLHKELVKKAPVEKAPEKEEEEHL